MVFSLCSELVRDVGESTIASKLVCEKQVEFSFGKPEFPTITAEAQLHDLVFPTSWFVFRMLVIEGKFLNLPMCEWKTDNEYQSFHPYVSTEKVVNDPAVSKDNRKGLLQVIEKTQKCSKRQE